MYLEGDKVCIEIFIRMSKRFGFCNQQTSSDEEINAQLERTLICKKTTDPKHVLHHLLPPYNFVLPAKASAMTERNFMPTDILSCFNSLIYFQNYQGVKYCDIICRMLLTRYSTI